MLVFRTVAGIMEKSAAEYSVLRLVHRMVKVAILPKFENKLSKEQAYNRFNAKYLGCD